MHTSIRLVALVAVAALGCSRAKPVPQSQNNTGGGPAPVEDKADVSISSAAAKPGQAGPGEEVVELDFNNDKRPDVYKFYPTGFKPARNGGGSGGDAPDRPLRTESDLNGDGKIDVWQWFSREGAVDRASYDLDFDGHVDVTSFFEKAVVIRKEVFHGFSEKPDTYKYFEKNKLVRVERDTNGDGRIDNWEYWENDQVDRIGMDSNGDGDVDRWIKPKKAQ